jgi:hypothetical protein
MKTTFWTVIISLITLCFIFSIAGRRYHASFIKFTEQNKWLAGKQDSVPVTESDLDTLPNVVARYLKYSGIVGKNPISYVHLTHEGKFRPGRHIPFLRIKGEYFITTNKPSFIWFGKLSLLPGLNITTIEQYFRNQGYLLIKLMSTATLARDHSEFSVRSSFGRCITVMSMAPSFLLDKRYVTWIRSDSVSAECEVADSVTHAMAKYFFNKDGSLHKIEVNRFYGRRRGDPVLEKFTFEVSGSKNFDGIILPEVFDGYWNLKEGDLHYIHFVVDKVKFN